CNDSNDADHPRHPQHKSPLSFFESSASYSPELLPVRQAALRTLQLLARRTLFLLDQITLDAAYLFRGLEDRRPRRLSLAKQRSVARGVRPVLAVHALDPTGMRVDPCHGILPGLDARADIELQDHVFVRVRREDVHRPLTALDRVPLRAMVVI